MNRICIALVIAFSASSAHSQEVEVPIYSEEFLKSTGRIITSEGKRVGTGFVCGGNYSILTAAHVATSDTMKFLPFQSKELYTIALKYRVDYLDLAVFERVGGAQIRSYIFDSFEPLVPGDRIHYSGWDSNFRITIDSANILSLGTTLRLGQYVRFIEFKGHGKHGYSGGPVFNSDGRVVAIITEGNKMSRLNSNTADTLVRAFSIEYIRVSEDGLVRTISDTKQEAGMGSLHVWKDD